MYKTIIIFFIDFVSVYNTSNIIPNTIRSSTKTIDSSSYSHDIANNKSVSQQKLICGVSHMSNNISGNKYHKIFSPGLDSPPNLITSDSHIIPRESIYIDSTNINRTNKNNQHRNSVYNSKDTNCNRIIITDINNSNIDKCDFNANKSPVLKSKFNFEIKSTNNENINRRYNMICKQLEDCSQVTQKENEYECNNEDKENINEDKNNYLHNANCIALNNTKTNHNNKNFINNIHKYKNDYISKLTINSSDRPSNEILCQSNIYTKIDNNLIKESVFEEKDKDSISKTSSNYENEINLLETNNEKERNRVKNKNPLMAYIKSIPFQVGNNIAIQSATNTHRENLKTTNLSLAKNNYKEDAISNFNNHHDLNSDINMSINNYISNVDSNANVSKTKILTDKRYSKTSSNFKNKSDNNIPNTINSLNDLNNNPVENNNIIIITNSNCINNSKLNNANDKTLNTNLNVQSQSMERKISENLTNKKISIINDSEVCENDFIPKTIKDFRLLNARRQLLIDKRGFCKFIQEDIKLNHSLLNLVYKKSILEPFFVRFILVMYNISVLLAMNAIFYTDGYLDAYAKAKKEGQVIIFVYFIYNDMLKSIWSSIVTIILCNVISLIIIVPKSYEIEFNNCLVSENPKVIKAGA